MIWRDDYLAGFVLNKVSKVPDMYAASVGVGGAVLATISANPLSATATIATIIFVVLKMIAIAPRVWVSIRWMFRK